MMRTRLKILGTIAVAAALALAPGSAMATGPHHPHQPMAYTCTGGEIASGTYQSIKVTGECSVPAGAVIKVLGNVRVAAGASLDAQSAPATIIVKRDVIGKAGSLVGLGCQPPSYTGNSAHECAVEPEGHSTITVHGNVMTSDAAAVLLNGISVHGNVILIGGGSGVIPWSIKNNTIRGNLVVSGQTTSWLGVLFNQVGKNAVLTRITVVDEHPDAPGVYVVRNTIGRNLVCKGLAPGVSGGFVPGSVNVVGGHAIGQCAALV